jgi:hypothetical protein
VLRVWPLRTRHTQVCRRACQACRVGERSAEWRPPSRATKARIRDFQQRPSAALGAKCVRRQVSAISIAVTVGREPPYMECLDNRDLIHAPRSSRCALIMFGSRPS